MEALQAFTSSAVLNAPARPKESEATPLASWVVPGREGRIEHLVSTSRSTFSFDLLHAIEVHTGWRKLSARHQRDFLVFASLADAERTVAGDAEQIAQQLGLKCAKRLYARVTVWAKHGLVSKSAAKYTVDPETRRSTFLPGSSWQLLPPAEASSASPELASLPESADEQKAAKIIATLEKTCGEAITGRSRDALYAALVENEPGVRECWKDAKARGNSPLRLFLRMVNDGDFRTKTGPKCGMCGQPHPTVQDRYWFFASCGSVAGDGGKVETLRCDACTMKSCLPITLDEKLRRFREHFKRDPKEDA
jgi:hypothetical protein